MYPPHAIPWVEGSSAACPEESVHEKSAKGDGVKGRRGGAPRLQLQSQTVHIVLGDLCQHPEYCWLRVRVCVCVCVCCVVFWRGARFQKAFPTWLAENYCLSPFDKRSRFFLTFIQASILSYQEAPFPTTACRTVFFFFFWPASLQSCLKVIWIQLALLPLEKKGWLWARPNFVLL